MSESRIERKVLALDGVETRGDDGADALPTSFSGHASAFFVPDGSWYTDIIAPGAFADHLPQFLARGFVGGINHDWCQPIGRPVSAVEDAKGLAVEASISHTEHGRDVARLLKDGVVKFLSIGFRTLGREWLEDAEAVIGWWSKQGYSPTPSDIAMVQGGARLITKAALYEFSPVTVPANWGSEISGTKGGGAGGGEPLADHLARVWSEVTELHSRLAAVKDLRGGDPAVLKAAGTKKLRAEVEKLSALLSAVDGNGEVEARGALDPAQVYQRAEALLARTALY